MQLTFTPGTESRSVFLQTNNDNNVEGQEQLMAGLAVDNNIYPGVTIGRGPASIDILDDDRTQTHNHVFKNCFMILSVFDLLDFCRCDCCFE